LFDRVHADGTAIVLVTHNAALAARARTHLTMRSGVLEPRSSAGPSAPRMAALKGPPHT
jgi:ABC-type lipoprotein export system ATPase subunit